MNKQKKLKKLPVFKSEDEERIFWATHSSADYIDWSQAKWTMFPNLKHSTETISLRLPAGFLSEVKALANKRDVPYQSLMKIMLAQKLAEEQRLTNPK